jgi:hypothetical protein
MLTQQYMNETFLCKDLLAPNIYFGEYIHSYYINKSLVKLHHSSIHFNFFLTIFYLENVKRPLVKELTKTKYNKQVLKFVYSIF